MLWAEFSKASMVYSTYLNSFWGTEADGLAVDSSGNAYINGTVGFGGQPSFITTSGSFQPTAPATDSEFVMKLDATRSGIALSSLAR